MCILTLSLTLYLASSLFPGFAAQSLLFGPRFNTLVRTYRVCHSVSCTFQVLSPKCNDVVISWSVYLALCSPHRSASIWAKSHWRRNSLRGPSASCIRDFPVQGLEPSSDCCWKSQSTFHLMLDSIRPRPLSKRRLSVRWVSAFVP